MNQSFNTGSGVGSHIAIANHQIQRLFGGDVQRLITIERGKYHVFLRFERGPN